VHSERFFLNFERSPKQRSILHFGGHFCLYKPVNLTRPNLVNCRAEIADKLEAFAQFEQI
jgi:hypothetical protein